MTLDELKLEINAEHRREEPFMAGSTLVEITPPINEEYWRYRVKVSADQAVVGFEKFGTVGIGFQHEEDWNCNLPFTNTAERIYSHIQHNRLDADETVCIRAIQMIQEAVQKTREQNDAKR